MSEVLKSDTQTSVSPDALKEIRGQIKGSILQPGEEGYDAARAIWNGMIDRRPALIVRAAGSADVSAAIRFAAKHRLPLAIRGGGHNVAGNAVCDGGLMLDLTGMKSVRIDPNAKTARVEPGVTLGEFDREAQAHGLVTPLGINSTTGVAGLTLGGGFGWISRKYGLTVDNLLSVEIVTADGTVRLASERENEDLFWAVRGGGGNFGVVTSFEYRLHPIGTEVLSGLIVHPLSKARELLKAYRDFVAKAPDELTAWVILRKAPPLPFLPPEVHGTEILVFGVCYVGDMEKGKKALAPLQALGKPIADVVGPNPYAGWQTAFDPLLAPGSRNYWKSHDFMGASDELIGTLVDFAGSLPGPECEILLLHLGGAINRVKQDATAYPHRNIEFVMNVHTRWSEASQDKEFVSWARKLYGALEPLATGGVYVNFMPEDEAQRVQKGAYGSNYDRLVKVKQKYDPENLFCLNQNIRP